MPLLLLMLMLMAGRCASAAKDIVQPDALTVRIRLALGLSLVGEGGRQMDGRSIETPGLPQCPCWTSQIKTDRMER